MSAIWATQAMLEQARDVLAERYPGRRIKIIDTFDLANVGWEADCKGALITVGDVAEIVIVDKVGGDSDVPDLFQVQDKLVEYAKLLGVTRGILDRYRDAGGLQGRELIEAYAARKYG